MSKSNFLLVTFLSCFLGSCTLLYREVVYFQADITDHKIFPHDSIRMGEQIFRFNEDPQSDLTGLQFEMKKDSVVNLNDILKETRTTAFLVIRNDSVLFENYYHGYDRSRISTFFSVSKSVTSLLVGIAIDEGYIKNANDPVTKYIPELKKRDPLFQKLTIKHLLDMRSGLHYNESYGSPFSHMARLYYATNQLGLLKTMNREQYTIIRAHAQHYWA